jgi:hypothetical protein
MNKILSFMTFISAFLLFSLIYLNPAYTAAQTPAEEDQVTPVTPQSPKLPQLPQLPDIGDKSQKNIHYNDVVLIGHGRIIKEDEVVNDAVVIGADLTVYGIVNGDAVCIGGNLSVGPQAVIKGDVVNIGGQLTIDPLARTNGELVNVDGLPFGFLKNMKGADFKNIADKMSIVGKILRLTVDCVCILFILFFAFLMVVFMPRQFNHIEEYLNNEFPRCTLLGIACMVGVPIVTVLFVISMVGILAVPFLLLAIIVSCMMGYVVFSRILGSKILANRPIMLQILIGLVLLHIPILAGDILLLSNGFIPAVIGHIFRVIGIVIFLCVNFIGLGAVVYSVWGTRTIAQLRGDRPNNFSSMSGGANTATA